MCQNVSIAFKLPSSCCGIRAAVLLPLTNYPGVKICQANNMSGETLFFKWEAMRYNRGPAPQLTLKDIHDVRAQIQRDIKKNTIAKKFTRGSLSGPQSRGFASVNRRPNVVGPAATPAKSVVRSQDGFDMGSRLEKKPLEVGPSRVTVGGLPNDKTSHQKRSCE